MSFFKDFKEDLSQAVNELMPEEEAAASQAAPAEEEESPTQSDNYSDLFAKFEDNASPAESEPAPVEEPEEEYEEVVEEIVEEVEVDEDYDGDEEEIIEEVVYVDEDGNPIDIEEGEEVEIIEEEEDEGFGLDVEEEAPSYEDTMQALSGGSSEQEENPVFGEGPINTVTTPIFEPEPQSAPINTIWSDSNKTDAGTIIRGMTVTGNIASDGSLDVHGAVDGNIEINGKLSVTGKIEGDSKADEIFINGAKIIGGLFSNNSVKVAGGSVIKGNIKASAAVVAGAVKGDIDVQGPVILDATAVIVGNIKSKSIQINNGAIIEGSCSQCYSDVTANNYFDEEE